MKWSVQCHIKWNKKSGCTKWCRLSLAVSKWQIPRCSCRVLLATHKTRLHSKSAHTLIGSYGKTSDTQFILLTRVNWRRRELRNIFCHMWSDQESRNFCLHNLKIYSESLTGRCMFIIVNLTTAAVCDKLRMCWLIWVEGGGLYRSGVQKSKVWSFYWSSTTISTCHP